MTNARRQLVRFSVLCMLILAGAGAAAADGRPLSIATYEYTDDWNPIAYLTYPAHIVANLATERLFLRRCTNRKVLRESRFDNLCQTTSLTDQSLPLAIDPSCTITPEDVVFSVQQIRQVKYNDFFAYDIEAERPAGAEWVLTSRKSSDPWKAKNAYSFPVVRKSGGDDFFKRRIDDGAVQRFNDATSGPVKLERIFPNRLTMVSRTTGEPRLRIDYYNVTNQLRAAMEAEQERPDIVLAMPPRGVSEDRYQQEESPYLNNFVYLGFNFKTKGIEHADLINDRQFRIYIAQSFWTSKAFADLMNIGGSNPKDAAGIFLGQALTLAQRAEVPRPAALKTAIQGYLTEMQVSDTTQFDLLFPPLVRELFSETQLNGILEHLNGLWGTPGQPQRFRITTPPDRVAFRRLRDQGKFHLILDTFFYGLNHLKYVAFFTPGAQQNYLGIKKISEKEINAIIGDKDRGLANLDTMIADRYPIAVIGSLRLRDLYSTSLPENPPAGGEQCEGDEVPVRLSRLYETMKAPPVRNEVTNK